MVASIGHVAITQRDVEEQYQFERFLQGLPPTGIPDAVTRKAVLSRLVSQKLLAEQISSRRRNPEASREAAEKTLKQVQKEFSTEQAYHSALKTLGMTGPQVLERLELYQRTLRMIDERLRPTAQPDSKEVEAYYKETFVPEYAKSHTAPPPALAQVRDEIQEILVQRKINQMLGRWLERLKSTSRVTIHAE